MKHPCRKQLRQACYQFRFGPGFATAVLCLISLQVFGLLLIIYDLIWLPMQVFDPEDSEFSIIMGVLSSIYWSAPYLSCCTLSSTRQAPIQTRIPRTFDIPLSFLVGFAVQDKGTECSKHALFACVVLITMRSKNIDWCRYHRNATAEDSVELLQELVAFRCRNCCHRPALSFCLVFDKCIVLEEPYYSKQS